MSAMYGRLAVRCRCCCFGCGDPMRNAHHARLLRRSVRRREARSWRRVVWS